MVIKPDHLEVLNEGSWNTTSSHGFPHSAINVPGQDSNPLPPEYYRCTCLMYINCGFVIRAPDCETEFIVGLNCCKQANLYL
jgi:hypothetical protein